MYLFYNHPLQSYGFRRYKSFVNSATHSRTPIMDNRVKCLPINLLNKLLGTFNEEEYYLSFP